VKINFTGFNIEKFNIYKYLLKKSDISNIYKYHASTPYFVLSSIKDIDDNRFDYKQVTMMPIAHKYSFKFFVLFKYTFDNTSLYLNTSKIYIRNRFLLIRIYANLNNYLNYNYWYFNYNKQAKNHLRERRKHLYSSSRLHFKGFKVQSLGRFSRRQRSSSHWFSIGRVPLNSMQCIIDYGYYTIPIINSAITVKVWIYKNSEINWFMKLT
jgi:hypothetical protein